MNIRTKYLVVGAGLAGVTIAHQLSFKNKVLLIEKDEYIGGLA
jgi:UDP-galactopyranose mutase